MQSIRWFAASSQVRVKSDLVIYFAVGKQQLETMLRSGSRNKKKEQACILGVSPFSIHSFAYHKKKKQACGKGGISLEHHMIYFLSIPL